jgi:predicted ATP-grasp superfamily ATP-dependent carboligase
MTKENDSILVFEYFTASGEKDKCIISEAEALIFALLDDLKDFNVDLVINKSYENFFKGYGIRGRTYIARCRFIFHLLVQ